MWALVLAVLATSCDTWDLPINEKLEFYRSVVAVGSWAELKTLAEDPNAPAILGLAKDIVLNNTHSTIEITRTLTIISFEGTHTISRGRVDATPFTDKPLFDVAHGGNLTLGGYAGKTLILDGGADWDDADMSSNSGVEAGASLIYVWAARLTIRDGAILRNNHNNEGGGSGIYISSDDDDAELIITGGTISGNRADGTHGGGGVYVLGNSSAKIARMTMTGGVISGNRADSSDGGGNGGGVYVRANTNGSSATLTMTGGAISGNIADNYGGGVYARADTNGSSATLTMTGGTISGNRVSKSSSGDGGGGGVYIYGHSSGSATLTMTGGVISGNTASGSSVYGGGIYVEGSAVFKKEPVSLGGKSGVIYGENGDDNSNTVEDTDGDLVSDKGHAVYVMPGSPSPDKKRDTTAGEDDELDSAVSGEPGGWDS